MTCPHCNNTNDDSLIPVWEDAEREKQGKQPKWVGCTNCHRMHRPELLRQDDYAQSIPQRQLTDHEVDRLKIGNQHSDHLSIIEWRVVKGAADKFMVADWTSKVDSTLSAQENITLMEHFGKEKPLRRGEPV